MRTTTALVCLALALPAAAQELETETARLLRQGAMKGGVGFEYQLSAEGAEFAAPTFYEVGLHDRVELVVEQVVWSAIRPKTGPSASGLGDLELTLVGLALPEGSWLPAIALAAEVKVPTARNALIGSGKADYTGYLILSRRIGRFDLHLNGGYAHLGAPPGLVVDDIVSFAAAAKLRLDDRWHLFAEVLGNSSSTPEGEAEGATTGAGAELAGGELFGTLGAGWQVSDNVLLSLGVSYDNTGAILVHPGLTLATGVASPAVQGK